MRTRGNPISPDARAAILAWTSGDPLTLNALARSLGVVPSSARTLRYRVKRGPGQRDGLRDGNEARRPGRCGVELIRTSDDLFGVGAKFTAIDLKAMVKFSALPDGTAFRVTPEDGEPYEVEMQGGELVRANIKGET